MQSLEALANEPILRKPKDNFYMGSVNAGIVLSSLGQPTGSMGYQTYTINDESRIEEIMVIGRPLHDDSKGVKVNPLLKNLPSSNNQQNQAINFLPQTITLTADPQQQKVQQQQQQQQYMNTLTNFLRNSQNLPNILSNSVIYQLGND